MKSRVVAYTSCWKKEGVVISRSQNDRADLLSSDKVGDVMSFLLQSVSYSFIPLRVVWDVDSFAAPILRLCGLTVCQQLADPTYRKKAILDINGQQWGIYYLRGRIFSVKKLSLYSTAPGPEANFYGISQYFTSDPSITAPKDAKGLLVRGNQLVAALTVFGISPVSISSLTSPVALYTSARWKSNPPDIPTVADLPDSAIGCAEYAVECSGFEWNTNYQIGHYAAEEIFNYDITSCYPSIAAELLDFRDADIWYAKSVPPDADYGFLKGRVTVDKDHPLGQMSPVMALMSDETTASVVGTWPGYQTLSAVRHMEKWGYGSFDMKDGWFIKFKRTNKPLYDLMHSLYDLRSLSPICDLIGKRVPNGIIGKMGEFRTDQNTGEDVLGDYYNPIFRAAITTEARLRVADFLYINNITLPELIAVRVDGLKLTRPVDLRRFQNPLPEAPEPATASVTVDAGVSLPSKPQMGSWRESRNLPCFVLGPSTILEGRERLIGRGMDYFTLKSLIEKHPAARRYETHYPGRVTLTEAVLAGDLSRLGEDKEVPAFVDLTTLKTSQDRLFAKLPKNGRQLLEQRYLSTAVEVG